MKANNFRLVMCNYCVVLLECDSNFGNSCSSNYAFWLQYRERIIFIGQYIDEEFGNQILATMLYLDSIDSNKNMYMYLNSPGGDVSQLSFRVLFMTTWLYFLITNQFVVLDISCRSPPPWLYMILWIA